MRHMRGRPPPSSGVPGATEAAEDLAADRVVPVAEGAPDRGVVGGPGAAAQHLVLVAPEDLAVLRVGEGLEAGVRTEVGGGPLPHVADQAVHALGADAGG